MSGGIFQIFRRGRFKLRPSVAYIHSFFASGEQGAWYEPSDISTLFQDSAGTTPVTAVEQPVGLILDKSLGAALGAELVVNGDFTSDTIWTKGAGWAIAGGKAIATSVAAFTSISQGGATLTGGKTYRIILNVSQVTAGGVFIIFSGGTSASTSAFTAAGTYTVFLTANTGNVNVLISSNASGFTGSVESISVREIHGNHATQATTTKRPVYSRRANLCYLTESMTPTLVAGTGWTRGAFGNWTTPASLGAQIAPDGTTNAAGIRTVGTGGNTTLVQRHNVAPSTPMVFRLWVRTVDGEVQTGLSGVRLVVQTGNSGTIVSAGYVSSVIGSSITGIWQQFEIQFTTPATGANQVEVGINLASASTASVAVWGASLTIATDAHLSYQRVNTATDYDADPNKFPAYLRFDGVDDALQTGNIDFTSTDKMTVWAGVNVNNLGDAGGHMVVVLRDTGFNTFTMLAPTTIANAISFGGTGSSASATSTETGLTASNFSAVLTGIADLAGNPASVLRRNSQQVVASSVATGGGMFVNAPLYVGAQNTTRFFNGRLYSLIVRGAQTPLSQIEATEMYIKQKMRMP